MSAKLSRRFYRQKTVDVAKGLLGQKLVHEKGRKRFEGIIVETEAYLGLEDPACHTYGGKQTPRTKSMYLDGGFSYVYFIYGMYFCFNVVTRNTKYPEAVLVRALEPVGELKTMMKLRNTDKLKNLCSGPGKLCQALSIDKKQDGWDLTDSKIYIEKAAKVNEPEIVAKPRIGIGYAGEAINWPLRFYIENSPWISKK